MPYYYTGIEAELYDEWFGDEPYEDQTFYEYFIRKNGGAALEIGSGTGRLMLPYLRKGLTIEGLDPSEEMIKQCITKAQTLNLKPQIYHQSMQKIEIDKKFHTIYIPFCSFQLVTDQKTALQTLKKFYEHLTPGGQLLIPLFTPEEGREEQNVWRIRRTLEKETSTIILSESIKNNRLEQLQTQRLKYEIYKNNSLEKTVLKTMQVRWYGKYEFSMMLQAAGFKKIESFGDYMMQEAQEDSATVIWHAIK